VVWVEGASAASGVEGVVHGVALDRLLLHGVDVGGGLDPDRLQDGGDDVGDVVVLVAQLPLGLDPLRPVHHQRVPDAAEVGVLLAQLEGGAAGDRPPDRVVVVGAGLAELVQPSQVLLHRLGDHVADTLLVEQTVQGALARRAVVADEHELGVEVGDEPTVVALA
jgi:hypothetical protein